MRGVSGRNVWVPSGRGRQEQVLGHVPECLWASVKRIPTWAWGVSGGLEWVPCSVWRGLCGGQCGALGTLCGAVSLRVVWDLNGWP